MSDSNSHTKIIIGSRGSDLALAQSRYVAARLRELDPSGKLEVEIEIIQTRGDRILDVPLAQVAYVRERSDASKQAGENHNEIESESETQAGAPTTAADRKGVFTKELEDALLEKRVDLAVHSYKDLPSLMPAGLCIAALPERVEAEDSILFLKDRLASVDAPFVIDANSRNGTDAGAHASASRPALKIGTSSVRRQALIAHLWPELECIDLRGNVPTRIKKLFLDANDPARPDAILLASAGLARLKAAGFFAANPDMQALLDRLEIRALPVDLFPPAPAQGALAIQCREDDDATRGILAKLHDTDLEACLDVERGILKALEGGCHLPLGAHCRRDDAEKNASAGAAKRPGRLSAYIFLGGEAEDNRGKRSFVARRHGANAAELRDAIISEIKSPMPIIVTGKADRLAELKAAHPRVELRPMPLLSTIETFSEDSRVGKDFDNWIMGQTDNARRLLAVFSVAGVRALSNLIKETGHNLAGIEWGVVGHKTAEALKDLLGVDYRFLSPDGTGAGLARQIAAHEPRYDAILALTAEKGREEFYEILFEHGIATLKLSLYRTETRVPEAAEFAQLPDRAKIVFGSPSAAGAFFTGLGRALPDAQARKSREAGWLYCALGPTTRGALQDMDKSVYASASEPDYDCFLEELSI
ncbi:MAG: uroporphyrinogen-III synthase [bacterium]|nr:uroporphyrinogen-III synthase [bacterium]